MPSFGNMLEVAELLNLNAIDVVPERCVAVRNRNSKCRKCADACIADCITVKNNEIAIASEACVNCGCCIAVCPTGALRAVEPAQAAVEAQALSAGDAASGMCVIACARRAAKLEGDPEKYAEVPCLGHVSEEELLNIAAGGLDDIVLVDGDCASCKFGAASLYIDEVLANASKLLDAADARAIVTRTSEFPPEVVDRERARLRGKSRRGLARQTGSYVKTVAGNVARKTIDEKLGKKSEPVTLRDRLAAGKSGHLPTFSPDANYKLLEDMEALGDVAKSADLIPPESEPLEKAAQTMSAQQDFSTSLASARCARNDGDAHVISSEANEVSEVEKSSRPKDASCENIDVIIDTRHFGIVDVDPEKCSGCGMCVMFCPTAALKYADYDEPEEEDRRYLEFQAADCTQCMLCKDVCLRYCLEVSPKVAISELYDFEPRLIEIARPKQTSGLGSFHLRNKK